MLAMRLHCNIVLLNISVKVIVALFFRRQPWNDKFFLILISGVSVYFFLGGDLLYLRQVLFSHRVELALKQCLHFSLDMLLINFHELFLLLLHFSISWRFNFSDFKSDSPDLYHIALLQAMALDILPCVEAVFHNLPQH